MTEGTMFTVETARKVLDVVDQGLTSGLGTRAPGQMCVEAAICYALGLPHGDDPGCVAASVRAFKIQLNDSRWSSNEARAKGLRALAIAQLGSKGVVDGREFATRLAEQTIRQIVPIALRAAAARMPAQAPDRALTRIADIALQVLREMNAPGVALWDQVNMTAPDHHARAGGGPMTVTQATPVYQQGDRA